MYEHRRSPPLPFARYLLRVARHIGVAAVVGLGSLVVGVLGFRYFEGLAWHEAFLDAALLLAGMGLPKVPLTGIGRVFAGVYALYAGLVFLAVTGIIFAPIVHRLLHRFHWDGDVDG